MPPNSIKVGKKIREIRKRAGLTIEALAKKVGISFLTLQRIETEKVSPSVALLSEIAYILDYPITALVAEEQHVIHIKDDYQQIIESQKLKLRILAHKGTLSDNISVSMGEAKKGEFISNHKNQGRELTYLIKGKNIFKYGQQEYELNEGDLLYHDGKEYHSVIALEPSTFLNIHFLDD